MGEGFGFWLPWVAHVRARTIFPGRTWGLPAGGMALEFDFEFDFEFASDLASKSCP
jgi:hypothetical protein